jgi:hypothetical protein
MDEVSFIFDHVILFALTIAHSFAREVYLHLLFDALCF